MGPLLFDNCCVFLQSYHRLVPVSQISGWHAFASPTISRDFGWAKYFLSLIETLVSDRSRSTRNRFFQDQYVTEETSSWYQHIRLASSRLVASLQIKNNGTWGAEQHQQHVVWILESWGVRNPIHCYHVRSHGIHLHHIWRSNIDTYSMFIQVHAFSHMYTLQHLGWNQFHPRCCRVFNLVA